MPNDFSYQGKSTDTLNRLTANILKFHQERTSEGISKLSTVLKDGGEQLSESASKVHYTVSCTVHNPYFYAEKWSFGIFRLNIFSILIFLGC